MSLPRGLLVSAAAILLAGCAASGADRGRIPIPVPPRDPTPVTAEAGHPQLVVTGDQVRVVLSSGATVLADADGPDVTLPSPGPGGQPPDQAGAALTITVTAVSGAPLTVSAADFQVRDELGDQVAMTADSSGGTAGPGGTVVLHLSGTIGSGDGSVTWAPGGSPLVVWDFVVETD